MLFIFEVNKLLHNSNCLNTNQQHGEDRVDGSLSHVLIMKAANVSKR